MDKRSWGISVAGWSFYLGVACFFATIAAYVALPAVGVVLPVFSPFYHYQLFATGPSGPFVADIASVVTAYAFTFVAGLLFFGLGSVAAGVLEGAKYASFAAFAVHPFDYLFFFPQIFAFLAASELSKASFEDYRGDPTALSRGFSASARHFGLGLLLLCIVYLARLALVR
ncbi:hypothetical protein HY995_03720 [Candidatus Micrarchaeota archaeon]|nr:hypothetical protein [Candidatus Micrarchaeota archaeon]MBI5177168.1 hypothetical protein [Candidatus Micrarchaeota archaeon]